MAATQIGLQQIAGHRRGDLIRGILAGFEGPERIGGTSHPAGLPATLAIRPEGALQVGQCQGDGAVEGILIDREPAVPGDLQGDERHRLIVAREAVAPLGVDDQALLQGREGPLHSGPDPVGEALLRLSPDRAGGLQTDRSQDTDDPGRISGSAGESSGPHD